VCFSIVSIVLPFPSLFEHGKPIIPLCK
jgi:hypothetical protein